MSFSKQLLAWFDENGRFDLPWQQNKTAYRVWVSEIMLQQTQVTTVIPYFERFMLSFPSLEDLAKASQDDVLAHWSGLGYYARGRNLHKAAQLVQETYSGTFPTTFDEIVALPGIGRSTAGAILSIAYQQKATILDGNVKRVLCRYDAVEAWAGLKPIEQKLWERAEELMPCNRYDDYSQALMDLGATLCKRSQPACGRCPLVNECKAFSTDSVAKFPYSKPKIDKPIRPKLFLILVDLDGKIRLQKRPQKGIWGGLWSLPQFDGETEFKTIVSELTLSAQDLLKLKDIKHSFTHYHLVLQPRILFWKKHCSHTGVMGKDFSLSQAYELGLPAPIRKLLISIEGQINVKNS